MKNKFKHGIAWDDKYKIGYENVDLQHHQLFELLSDLVTMCIDGSDTEKLKSTIDFLVNYTVKHFADEEAVQIQWKYPEYIKHKQLHENFKTTMGGIVNQYTENGSSVELSNNVNTIVINWIIYHIQNEDKKIGDYIRKMGSE